MSKDYCLETPGYCSIGLFDVEVSDDGNDWFTGKFIGYKLDKYCLYDVAYPYTIIDIDLNGDNFRYCRHVKEKKIIPWEFEDYCDAVVDGATFYIMNGGKLFNPNILQSNTDKIFINNYEASQIKGYSYNSDGEILPCTKLE